MTKARKRNWPIDLPKQRERMKPRQEPYWGPRLLPNFHLGFYKSTTGTETWIARLKVDGRRITQPLGYVIEGVFEHAQAVEAAHKWWKERANGGNDPGRKVPTVQEACAAYVAHQRKQVSDENAHDAERRFARTIDDTPLGRTSLAALDVDMLTKWLHKQTEEDGLKPATANRNLTALKAALNHAYNRESAKEVPVVTAEMHRRWSAVKPYKKAGKRRDVYLDVKQRRALLAAAKEGSALHDLLNAAMLTGARPGELVKATRRQFDARLKMMTFDGKVGARTVQLSAPAVTLFKKIAQGKEADDRLLTRDDGKPWNHSDWDELVRDVAAAAGLKNVVLYTLRHCYVTQAIKSGMTTLETARQVGTSLKMIEEHYGHLVSVRSSLAKVVMT